MNFVGRLVITCLLLAVFQRAVALLLVLLALVWIYGFIMKPAETIGFLFLLTMAACIRTYPGWSLVVLGLLSTTALIAKIKLE